jgi:hypothetical protein
MISRWKMAYTSIVFAWLCLTAFVDFAIIPTAFKQLSDIFIAGNLGMHIFSALNYIEITFAVILLLYSFKLFQEPKTKKNCILIIINALLIGISCLYFFYLTEKISDLTELWKNSMVISKEAIEVVKSEHHFYHQLYIRTDSFKLLLLLIVFCMSFIERREDV